MLCRLQPSVHLLPVQDRLAIKNHLPFVAGKIQGFELVMSYGEDDGIVVEEEVSDFFLGC